MGSVGRATTRNVHANTRMPPRRLVRALCTAMTRAIGNTLATETSATTTTATATMASEAFLAELESVECLDSANRTLNPKCRDTTSRHSLLLRVSLSRAHGFLAGASGPSKRGGPMRRTSICMCFVVHVFPPSVERSAVQEKRSGWMS